jgi:hypothetical protein
MSTDEAILILAIGFMVIIGIWLTTLTYLVLKKAKIVVEKKPKKTEEIKDETPKEE